MSKIYDLIGMKFGKLTVIKKAGSFPRSEGKTEIKWKCVCECGNTILASTANLNNGKTTQCNKCAHEQTGLKRRQDLTGQKFGLLTVKGMVYNFEGTNETRCICDCDCGNTDVIKIPYSLKTGKIKSCGCIKGVSQRQKLEGKKFGKLLVVEEIFISSDNHKLRCLCDCGNEIVLSRRDVMTGHTKSCGCLKKEFMKEYYENHDQSGYISDYGVEILDRAGKNSKGQTLWNCKCGLCGRIFQELPARIKDNHVRSCGCLVRSSREMFIEKFFNECEINYKSQYTFDDCKSDKNYVLRYDFALFDNDDNLLLLIEYDGEQHYMPINLFGGEVGFKNTVERDKIKNNYCLQHKIPLLRIPYNKTETEITEIINNTLESVTTTGGIW